MLSRSFLKPAFFLAAIALVSAAVTVGAAEPAAPAEPKIAAVILSPDEAVQKELEELDRILIVNPKFEEILRANIDRIEAEEFRKTFPDVDALLTQKPGLVPALKVERHFLIHRYVLRRARGPLLRPDVLALDKFLTAHADIRRELDRDPAQILDGKFLIAHPGLAEFFDQHPGLSTVLLEKQAKPAVPKHKKAESSTSQK